MVRRRRCNKSTKTNSRISIKKAKLKLLLHHTTNLIRIYKMAKSKYKIGDKLQFNFAGMPCEGIVERIDNIMWGTVERQWIRCKGADGTIYPLEESEDSIIKIK